MAVIHIKNIHNHKIKVGFRNEPLPPYFDGYVDTLSGNIVDPVSNVDTFLQSVKGEVDEAVNKLAGFEDALSCTVTVAQVDSRLEEVEGRITNLVTCANSKKTFDLGSYGPVYDDACLHKTDGKPVEFFYTSCSFPIKIEPGLYLGRLPSSSDMCEEIEIGDVWTYYCIDTQAIAGSCKNQKGVIRVRFSPQISYKNKYNFEDYQGAIYEIDEKAAEDSYIVVETNFYCKCNEPNLSGCYHWCCKVNKPYECVKDCFEAIAKHTVNITGTLIRLQ